MAVATSIILPTYNRARFLPQAFASITAQQFTDWELIVVDDGSTDGSREIIERELADIKQPTRYIRQENRGAYAARNNGLDLAQGEYIAFFDSDDEWLPHHLHDCVGTLRTNPDDIDWVYGALQRIDSRTGEVVEASNQLIRGRAGAVLQLTAEPRGRAFRINDGRMVEFAIRHGITGGLQTAVIRRTVFDDYRFDEKYRNGQDRFAVINAMIAGFGFAYFKDIHLTYRIHDSNDSLVGGAAPSDKQLDIERQLINQYEELLQNTQISRNETRAVRKRLLQGYFWNLGYSALWMRGRRREGIEQLQAGLQQWPWSIACWKTYFLCRLRSTVS